MSTLRSLAGAQGLMVAAVLVVAGMAKLSSAALRDLVRTSALTTILGSGRRSRVVWATIAGLELALGIGIVLLPDQGWLLALAASLLALGMAYTVFARRVRAGSPCGCFGRWSGRVSSGKSLLRSGVLLVCALVGVTATVGWNTALDQPIVWPLLVVEVSALTWLFPERHELAVAGRRRLEHWRAGVERWRLGRDCVNAAGPPASETRSLSKSELWTRVAQYLSGNEATDVWREGCWEFATFAGRYEGAPATVVFGVALDPWTRKRTVAVVDEADGAVVLREEMLNRRR